MRRETLDNHSGLIVGEIVKFNVIRVDLCNGKKANLQDFSLVSGSFVHLLAGT